MSSPQITDPLPKMVSQLLVDEPELRDVVEDFVGGLQERISEIQQAYEAVDWDLLRTLAHRLKGAGGSYGYPELSRIGAVMEESFRAHCADDFNAWVRRLTELTAAARAGLEET